MFEVIAEMEALDINYVPTKGGSEAITMLAGGQVQLAFSGGYHVQYPDQLKLISATTAKRHAGSPEVETAQESGYPVALDSHMALVVHADTPDDVVALLDEALTAALASEEVRGVIEKYRFAIDHQRGEEAKATILEQTGFYRELVERAPAN
jgi:tripartite-type tricarboxylate transporter receptor subunit TctC